MSSTTVKCEFEFQPRAGPAAGQRTGATGSASESYAYDANGNRETVTNTSGSNQDYDTGGDNRLVDDDTFTYTYDNEGNRLTRTRISSAQADDKTTEYTWDHRNRLVKVTYKNNAGTITKTVDNAYDAANQWVRRVVDPDGATGSALPEQTIFAHENGQVALQFDKTGTGNLAAADLSHRYLWGPIVDQVLADEQVNDLFNAVNNDLLWALTDHKGTVHDVVDNSGNVVNHLVYDTAGNVISQTDPLVNVFFRYNGKPYDATIGGYWMQARWYDPLVGRWLSQDLIWDGSNKYAFVGNEPTIYVDYNGQARERDGHHIVPRQLWDEFGFADETKEIFESDTARIGSIGSHNFTGHGGKTGYTAHVRDELSDQMQKFFDKCKITDGKLTIEQQKQFATQFVDHIKQ